MIKVWFSGKFQKNKFCRFNLPGLPSKDETSERTVQDVFSPILYFSGSLQLHNFLGKSLFIPLKNLVLLSLLSLLGF